MTQRQSLSAQPDSPCDFVSTKPSVLDRPKNKNNATVLLVGETGVGKTTLLSLIINLLLGKTAWELEDVHKLNNESGLDQTRSQTTKSEPYTVKTLDGFKLTILDTPGLADTRGTKMDQTHVENIRNAIRNNGIMTIDAALIVLNGTNPRQNAISRYALNLVTTIFPKSVSKIIGIVLTNSTSRTSNFQRENLPPEVQKSPFWFIENPRALLKKLNVQAEVTTSPTPSHNEKRKPTKKEERDVKNTYEDAVEDLNIWIKWLDETRPETTKEIIELCQKSREIESKIIKTVSLLKPLAIELSQLKTLSEKVKKATKDKTELKEFIDSNEGKVFWEYEHSDQAHVLCVEPGCHSNCDFPDLKRLYAISKGSDPRKGPTKAPMAETRKAAKNFAVATAVSDVIATAAVAAEMAAGTAGASGIAGTLGTVSVAVGTAAGLCTGVAGIVGLVGLAAWKWVKTSNCPTCNHKGAQHTYYNLRHTQRTSKVDQRVMEEFLLAQTSEVKEMAAEKRIKDQVASIEAEIGQHRTSLNQLMTEYKELCFEEGYAEFIDASIKTLREHKEERKQRLGTEAELELIDKEIGCLEEKLRVLGE